MSERDCYAAAVGFDYQASRASKIFDNLDDVFGNCEVNYIGALADQNRGGIIPDLWRLKRDTSGATMVAGGSFIRFGFLPEGGREDVGGAAHAGRSAFVSVEEADDPVMWSARGYVDFFDLDGYGNVVDTAGTTFFDTPIEEVENAKRSPEVSFSVPYYPLNVGAHDFATGKGQARCGHLQVTGLWWSNGLEVITPKESHHLLEKEMLTRLDEIETPESRVCGEVIAAERLTNGVTGQLFWHLEMRFADGIVLNFCSEHPFLPTQFPDFDPYPVGAIIRGTAMFTGYFLPDELDLDTGLTKPVSHTAIANPAKSQHARLQGGLPSSVSEYRSGRDARFERDMSSVIVHSDIPDCLGFDFDSYHTLYDLFAGPKSDVTWCSRDGIEDFSAEVPYVNDFAHRPSATVTMSLPIDGLDAEILIGLALPTNSWGAGFAVHDDRRILAGVDCKLYRSAAEIPESFETQIGEGSTEEWSYGESQIGAVSIRFPQLHTNPFTDGRFLSVQTYLNEEAATIVLPCPEWLAEEADRYDDDSNEIAATLLGLSGAILVGRFDNCAIELITPADLKNFDSVIRQLTPEPPIVQLEQRSRWPLQYCYRNPEMDLNAHVVRLCTGGGEVSYADMLRELNTGPVGFIIRVMDIFDRYGVNLLGTTDDTVFAEQEKALTQWIPVEPLELGSAVLACRAANSLQREGSMWNRIPDVEYRLAHLTSGLVNSMVNSAFGRPARPGKDDPSVQDYLTEDDSFDVHMGVFSAAVVNKQKVSVLYGNRKDEPTARVIRPVKVVVLNRPYVLAWDELREDWRTFRVDRVKTCSVLDEYFEPMYVPLPEEMPEWDLEDLREEFGFGVDNATLRVAWSVRNGW